MPRVEGTAASGPSSSAPAVALDPPAQFPSPAPQVLPKWLARPKEKLAKFLRYAGRVYNLFQQLSKVPDQRRRPRIPTELVTRGLFLTALLRLPSLNAFEGETKRAAVQRWLGLRVQPGVKAFSADTAARVLDGAHLDSLRQIFRVVIGKAERNKVFRDGLLGAKRCVALDAWEVFSSNKRCCSDCLQRQVRCGDQLVLQYYHRVVVALLLGDDLDLVLDLEPLRSLDLRRKQGESVDTHDGEQTAAIRLLRRLHMTYGRFIDLLVLDALYPDGPMMSEIIACSYGAIITAKKETDEPLKDALALMKDQPPVKEWVSEDNKEHFEAWDVDEIETLDTFKGKARVVRVQVASARTGKVHTWTAVVIGDRARKLPIKTVHRLQRMRWHEENTAFNQWTQQWHLGHAFRHKPNAVMAVLLLWCLAFNLMQLFAFRRLRRTRVPKDPCDTIRAIVVELRDALCALTAPIPWRLLLDSG